MIEMSSKMLGKGSRQEREMGALTAFLASGRATLVTGQFFGFTGG